MPPDVDGSTRQCQVGPAGRERGGWRRRFAGPALCLVDPVEFLGYGVVPWQPLSLQLWTCKRQEIESSINNLSFSHVDNDTIVGE